jgi:hypothetical protein
MEKLRIEILISPYPNLTKTVHELSKILKTNISETREFFHKIQDGEKIWVEKDKIENLIFEGWKLFAKSQEQIDREYTELFTQDKDTILYNEAKQWYDNLDEKTKSYVDILNTQFIATAG